MPCYDFQCIKCLKIDENVLVAPKEVVERTCSVCGFSMTRMFPTAVHVNIDHIVDGGDRGKVVSEKNKKLKKMHAGYEHEEQNLRKSITQKVKEKMEKK
jgi:hypothetical protein